MPSMEQAQKKAVSYSAKENAVIVYDDLTGKELYITKWSKIGRGNTSISTMDNCTIDQAYVVFLHDTQWYHVTVNAATGVFFEKIDESSVDKYPLIWLDNGKNSNW
jgi:hypothetical protein